MIHRRAFLASLAAMGGGAGVLLVLRSVEKGKDNVVLQLDQVLTVKRSARWVGLAYLEEVPSERDVQNLSELVFSEIKWETLLRSDIREVIRRQVRRDFRNDNLVRIRGWLLSRTEARLCALSALSSG